jgi:hypothetical protein
LKEESIFKWSVALMVINPESYYNGGYFKVMTSITTLNYNRG